MSTKPLIYVCLVICGLFASRTAFSQRTQGNGIPFRTPGNDSLKVVQILNAKTYHSETKNDSTQLTFLVGDVRIKQEHTLIDCDSMILMYFFDHTGSFNVRASNRLAALAANGAGQRG